MQTGLQFDPTQAFARDYGVPWAGKDGFHRITLTCGESVQTYNGYCNHGRGGAQTKGAKANQLQRALRDVETDYVVLAHLHDQDSITDTTYGPDEHGIIGLHTRCAVRCGAWLTHGPGSYSREAMFSPGHPGAPTLLLYTERHAVHPRT